MQIDGRTALLVCAGPSLDRLTRAAWASMRAAGAVVAVNGALVARCCGEHRVRFDYAAAMDVAAGLGDKIPGFDAAWRSTAAWRVSASGTSAPAESFVAEVEHWSDSPDAGYVGGSTAMVVGNWICNPWPSDPDRRAGLAAIGSAAGKTPPARGFRRLAFVGLDMVPGQGSHAVGAGSHRSGFAESATRYRRVCDGWGRFLRAAEQRGIEVCNLSPDTGLTELPRPAVPASWFVRSAPGARRG